MDELEQKSKVCQIFFTSSHDTVNMCVRVIGNRYVLTSTRLSLNSLHDLQVLVRRPSMDSLRDPPKEAHSVNIYNK